MKNTVKKFTYSAQQRAIQTEESAIDELFAPNGWNHNHCNYVNGIAYTQMHDENCESNWDDAVTVFVGDDYKITRK